MTITAKQIIQEVVEEWGVSRDEIMSRSKVTPLPEIRRQVMYRLRTETKAGSKSMYWIAKQLNRSDHTVVRYGLEKFKQLNGDG